VKLVLAASMWNSPHLLIMDEPTNYLDRWGTWAACCLASLPAFHPACYRASRQHVVLLARLCGRPCAHSLAAPPPKKRPARESLGALATAIKEFDGGVVLISHNNEFTSTCCNETWYVRDGKCEVVSAVRGPPGWRGEKGRG
jgi:hypothetical protein